MKLIFFTTMFVILVATTSLAKGLEITEIDVHVDYDEAHTYKLENRDNIDSDSVPVANNSKINVDVFPGSNITFTIRVENTFQSEKIDIKDTDLKITIEGIDDGADLEEESTGLDLEPGDDKRIDIKFSVPLDVDAGTYKVVIGAEGEDKNSTLYETEVKLKLEVRKLSHDIRITKALLTPSTLECKRKTRLTAEIVNAGSNFENEVAIEFRSQNLGVNSYDKDISLESSNEADDEEKMYTKTLNIEVPSFLKAAAYPISVNLYWKNFVLFDTKTVYLNVKDCNSTKTKTEPEHKNHTESAQISQPEYETNETPKELIRASQEIPILSSQMLLLIFLGLFAIIFLSIAIIFAYNRNNKV